MEQLPTPGKARTAAMLADLTRSCPLVAHSPLMAGARGASAKPSRCPLVSLPEDSALLLPAPTTQPGLKVARRSRRRRSSR